MARTVKFPTFWKDETLIRITARPKEKSKSFFSGRLWEVLSYNRTEHPAFKKVKGKIVENEDKGFTDRMHAHISGIDFTLIYRYMDGEVLPTYANLYKLILYIKTFIPNFNVGFLFCNDEPMTKN